MGNWRLVADEVGIASCPAKSCCQRWKSKHQPNLITGPFSDLEDAVIIAALQVKHNNRSLEVHMQYIFIKSQSASTQSLVSLDGASTILDVQMGPCG